MYIYIWVMRTWSQTVMVSWCACWNVCDPINPFSLKWDKQQVLRGTLIGQGMNQHQQFRLVTSWSSHPHMAMWNDFMSMTSYFSKFFVPIPLPPYCIKWCWHLHTSSDALSTLSNTGLLSCHFSPVSLTHGTTTRTAWSPSPFGSNSPHPTRIGPDSWNHVKLMILAASRMNIICKRPLHTSRPCANIYVQCAPCWSWGWQSRWFNWRVSFETTSVTTTTSLSWT